ncbi:MAG: DUF4810 domain-containing protein [Candidatus Stygibacter australis]|nr:DUF4810 domain-containing protein [Candidatus Stygibacter australis]
MKMKSFFLTLMLLFLAGCIPQTLYYWGSYSSTLYKYKKDQSDENLQKHKNSIKYIIKRSPSLNRKVPPGVYCEYGYYLALEGNYTEAEKFFELEKENYPESEKFINTLIGQLQISEEEVNE